MMLLFLNSIGTGEVVFILLIVLMLFGSKSIPGLARGLGKGMREIRDASNEIKRDIQNSALEMRKDLRVDEEIKKLEDFKLEDEKKDDITKSSEAEDDDELGQA